MLIRIDRLGPTSNASVRLGEITLLMGPPNAGKSYTLKSLYTKLFLLDDYAATVFRKSVSERIRSALLGEMREAVDYMFGTMLNIVAGNYDPRELAGKGYNVDVTRHENSVSITARRPIQVVLGLDALSGLLKDSMYSVAYGSLPYEYLESVTLEPVDLSKDAHSILSGVLSSMRTAGFREVSLPPIDVGKRLNALIEEGAEKPGAEIRTSVKFQPAESALNVTIEPALRVDISAEALNRLASAGAESRNIAPAVYSDLIADTLAEKCGRTASKMLLKALQSYIASATNVDSVRFIPPAKGLAVAEVEYISHDPDARSAYKEAFSEIYPTIMASHVYWTVRGREALMKGELTDRQKNLLRASVPLLEGTLSGEGLSVVYRDWRGSSTDLRYASSLVHEVAGVLLPLLTVGDRPLVLVDEPASHLHPRAQVIMALFIAALPKLCGCRVVASTHSDLFAVTIAQLAVQKPEREWVAELINELVPHVSEGVNELSEAVAKSARSSSVRVYEYRDDGTVKQIQLESILSERIPGASEVVDKLIEWSSRLSASRASETRQISV